MERNGYALEFLIECELIEITRSQFVDEYSTVRYEIDFRCHSVARRHIHAVIVGVILFFNKQRCDPE